MSNYVRPGQSMAVGSVIQLDEVKHIPAIAALPIKEKNSLLLRLRRRIVMSTRLVFKQGEVGQTMAFIASGNLKVRYPSRTSTEVIVALLGPGDYAGEIGMVTGRPRSFDVMTLGKTELFELSREEFIAHTHQFKGLSFSLLVSIAGRLDDSAKRIIDLGEQDIPTRIIRTLTHLAKPQNVQGKIRFIVTPRPSLNDIIGLIGAPREKVSDALRGLERNGSIVLEEHRIVIQSI